MGKMTDNRKKSAAALGLLCLTLLALFGCAAAPGENTVVCGNGGFSRYAVAAARMLPFHMVRRVEAPAFPHLQRGAAVEAFDAQALPALETGLANHWYPQYLATVVIAVDRGQTDAVIRGWGDLAAAGQAVGFNDVKIDCELLMAAMSYGLEGEAFTLGRAAGLLAQLQAKRLLVRRAFHTPVVICYDYQAAAMAESGRDIEVVVPREGTLTFVKGLLSNRPLAFEGDADAALRSAGLRLPGEEDYENAVRLMDYTHLNTVCQDAMRVLRRTVLRTRLYTSADGREHLTFILFYMILVVMWTAAVVQRAMQKGVRRAALATGAILLCWSLVRLVKYQLDSATGLDRYLWYSFYLFQLALPLALLWLAWTIDQPGDRGAPPEWLVFPALAGAALAVLVFTNDLHHWVLRIDYGNPNWSSDYSYGPGYYVVMACCVVPALAALALMLLKSGRNPRKRGFVLPLAFCGLLAVYGAGYLLRVPLAWESDITMVMGLFTLLFLETAIRAGMIPVNTKYKQLFTHSPLAMQIADSGDNIVLSGGAGPLRRDGDTLLFAAPIAGGRALWQEDIGALNRLHREVEEQARKQAVANTVLAEEERIKRAAEEENARTQLMSQLEDEIAGHTARLSAMLESAGSAAGIVLLLCYIKRRCNLFFRERETQRLPADELAVYIDELAELAGYAGVKIISSCVMSEPLGMRRATLFYDFFYSAVGWAAQQRCPCMLAHCGDEQGTPVMRLMSCEDAMSFRPPQDLAAAIAAAQGLFSVKDLDGAAGLSLSFPEGGEGNG